MKDFIKISRIKNKTIHISRVMKDFIYSKKMNIGSYLKGSYFINKKSYYWVFVDVGVRLSGRSS